MSSLREQGAHGAPFVDPPDGFAEDLGDRKRDDLPAAPADFVQGNGVRDDELFERRSVRSFRRPCPTGRHGSHAARTRVAPRAFRASALRGRGSRPCRPCRRRGRMCGPLTSPMTLKTWATFGAGRRLSMMASPASSRRAKYLARPTPPASGETTVRSPRVRLWICLARAGVPVRLSTGKEKKPWIWGEWRSIVRSRPAPAASRRSAMSRAEIGHARPVLPILARIAVVRHHGRDPLG